MHPNVPEVRTTVKLGNNITLTATELHKHSAIGATFHKTVLTEVLAPKVEVRCVSTCRNGEGGATID